MASATAAQIKTALASGIKQAEADLADHWATHCTRAEVFGRQECEGRLLARGFRLVEEIRLWDRLFEFSLDLGVWKAVMLGGAYGMFDPTALAALDRRTELDSVFVAVAGVYIKPSSAMPGTVISGGPMVNDDGVFNFDASQPDNGFRW